MTQKLENAAFVICITCFRVDRTLAGAFVDGDSVALRNGFLPTDAYPAATTLPARGTGATACKNSSANS